MQLRVSSEESRFDAVDKLTIKLQFGRYSASWKRTSRGSSTISITKD